MFTGSINIGAKSFSSTSIEAIFGLVEDRNKSAGAGGFCTDNTLDTCTWAGSGSYNYHKNGAHAFRITAAPGSKIGVKLVTHDDKITHGYNDTCTYWNGDLTFYINGKQVASFPRVAIYSAHKYISAGGIYYIYVYDANSAKYIDSIAGPHNYDNKGDYNNKENAYTMPEDVNAIDILLFLHYPE